jgi:hypothetical protein
LGENLGVAWVRYSRTSSASLGVILPASASVITLLLTIALATSGALVAGLVFALITVAGGAGVLRTTRRIRAHLLRRTLCWYRDGVAQTHPDRPAPEVLRWIDVDSVTLTFNDADETFNGLSRCALAGDAGTAVSADGAYPKPVVRQVADLAGHMLSPRLTATLIGTYESGEPELDPDVATTFSDERVST